MNEQTDGYKDEIEFSNEIIETLVLERFDKEVETDLAFYLYLNSENNAKQSAQKLIDSGVNCEVEESEDEQWLCYVTASIVPSTDNLQVIGKLLLSLADTYSGELDGWEVVPDYSFSMDSITNYTAIGREVLESLELNYQPNHEFKEVKESDFPDLNKDFYNETQSALEKIGFKHISDLEDLTVSTHCAIVTLIRVMAHPETNSIVAFYDVPIIGMGICEFETLLSNDVIVVSSTSPESYEIANTPMIIKMHYSDIDCISELYQIHRESVNCEMSKNSELSAKSINTFEDIVSTQNMQNQFKYDYLKSIGWVTKEYLIAQANGDEVTAVAVYDAIQDILSKRT